MRTWGSFANFTDQTSEFGYLGPKGQVRSFDLQNDPHFRGLQSEQGNEYADPTRLNQLLGEELRTAGIQNDKGLQAAEALDLSYFKSGGELFLQGLNLYKVGNPGDNDLLRQLEWGHLKPGDPDYARARDLAEQRFKVAYAGHIEYETKLKFSKEAAKYQAEKLDLASYDTDKLFNRGLNLFDKNADPRQEQLLRDLRDGKLKVGSAAYEEARALAEARYKVAYQKALEPPPKANWLKTLVSVVIAAVVVYFTAGAASVWAAGYTGATVTAAGTVATTVTAAGVSSVSIAGVAATAIGSAVGAYAGAVIGAGIQTGSLSKALKAGENSLKGGVASIIVNVAAASLGFTAGNVGGLLGTSERIGQAVVNSVTPLP